MASGRSARNPIDAFRHEALSEIGSTNDECLARARAGDPGGLWVTATRQTGGRGRRGRAWSSEPGNLYASLLLVDPAPLERLPSLPLAVAVAVYDAIRAVLPHGSAGLAIKWPNDILIGRAKTCGILLEGARVGAHHALVIGVGVNIATKPGEAQYPVTMLSDHGVSASPDELFAHLFMTMAETLDLWDEGRGVARVVARWRASACGIGEKITVNLPDRSISGRFTGIDDMGQLILETETGALLPIAAGDVFFG